MGAVDAEKLASDARDRTDGHDLQDRLSRESARADATDVDAMRQRTANLTDEEVAEIVGEATRSVVDSEHDVA